MLGFLVYVDGIHQGGETGDGVFQNRRGDSEANYAFCDELAEMIVAEVVAAANFQRIEGEELRDSGIGCRFGRSRYPRWRVQVY